ncbi:hypothetical protein [Loigolactobacillus backii]|uniref:hypothetical protein n=1 Tax=Loigolactobacillus backii TaxID=375175 RepID=UPI0007F0BFE8|nr:hypothetical protein [Loigolactobacillus backii]ANK66566.1 hypothetical protein AYR55_01965 [Loigolactobacillus backii]OLF70790.1 hypothetical protein ACX53_00240 [Loigolactobacillus backii]PIO87277.1 hypothetical protein B8A32_09115 [Loigolactobacillus backii]
MNSVEDVYLAENYDGVPLRSFEGIYGISSEYSPRHQTECFHKYDAKNCLLDMSGRDYFASQIIRGMTNLQALSVMLNQFHAEPMEDKEEWFRALLQKGVDPND